MDGYRKVEYLVARHCAAALVGIKPSSLFALSHCDLKHIEEIKSSLTDCGVRLKQLGLGGRLALVYRHEVLNAHLTLRQSREFLAGYGYEKNNSTDDDLKMLALRLNNVDAFPHEIGIFLGYPIGDIEGFIQKPKSEAYSGMWKVYSDVPKKQRLMRRYMSCADALTKKILSGKGLSEILSVK